jgi:hypothetical protein
MHTTTASALLVATLAVGGCRDAAVGPDGELAAPPNQFVVTTGTGAQLTGPAARIDIRHVDAAQPPDVEIAFSASGNSGRTWSVLSAAPADFLPTLALTARVVDGRVGVGTASVQVSLEGNEAQAAPGGLLSLRLYAGRVTGETSRMDNEFAARFEGPFVVTCAVPAPLVGGEAPASNAAGTPPTLTVDEHFESGLCRPYATLGGWSGVRPR